MPHYNVALAPSVGVRFATETHRPKWKCGDAIRLMFAKNELNTICDAAKLSNLNTIVRMVGNKTFAAQAVGIFTYSHLRMGELGSGTPVQTSFVQDAI
jgi:hypothetical protein